MKTYYTYINNTLYFDSFTQQQIEYIEANMTQFEIVQICEEEKENMIYIQLNYTNKLERVIDNLPYRKIEERQQEKIIETIKNCSDIISINLIKNYDVLIKYDIKNEALKIKKIKIEKI